MIICPNFGKSGEYSISMLFLSLISFVYLWDLLIRPYIWCNWMKQWKSNWVSCGLNSAKLDNSSHCLFCDKIFDQQLWFTCYVHNYIHVERYCEPRVIDSGNGNFWDILLFIDLICASLVSKSGTFYLLMSFFGPNLQTKGLKEEGGG